MPGPTPLHLQRCFHHASREAVGRCPSCSRFYCRECLNDHQGRLLCASCLRRLLQPPPQKQRWLPPTGRVTAAFIGLLLVWLVFYALGAILISIPSDSHELKTQLFQDFH